LPVQPELSNVDKSYWKFGPAGGFLLAQMLGPPISINVSSIISHMVVTPLKIRGYEVLHILSMDRVSYLPLISKEELLMTRDHRLSAYANADHM